MIPETWPRAAPDLLPVLRPTWAPAGAWRAGLDDPERALPRLPLAPFLTGLVVWDGPELRRFVQRRHLRAWGQTLPGLWLEALSHLPEAPGLDRAADGLWRLASGDGYASSRPLLPGWARAFVDAVPGEVVMAIPHAREVLVAGGDDLRAVARLHAAALRGFTQAGDPISPVLYTASAEGGLAPWRPAPDHPLAEALEEAERLLARVAYARQDEELLARGHRPAPLRRLDDGRLAALWRPGAGELLADVELAQRPDGGLLPLAEAALPLAPGWNPPRRVG